MILVLKLVHVEIVFITIIWLILTWIVGFIIDVQNDLKWKHLRLWLTFSSSAAAIAIIYWLSLQFK